MLFYDYSLHEKRETVCKEKCDVYVTHRNGYADRFWHMLVIPNSYFYLIIQISNSNLFCEHFVCRSISMSDIYIGFFIADNFSFFIEGRHKIRLDVCEKSIVT